MSKLLELEKELLQWRVSKNGSRGREIPKELRLKAVELLKEYSAWQLQKRLRISTNALKSWEKNYSSEQFFIPLPAHQVLGPLKIKEKKTLSENLSLKVSRGDWSVEGSLSLKEWQGAIRLLEGVK